MNERSLPVVAALAVACAACSSTTASRPLEPVAASPPPKDDGEAAQGGSGGHEHAAALEQLRGAPLGPRVDHQGSVRVQLPDAARWTRVRFWGMKSLVGFRYGKEHHAVVAAFVMHVADTEQGACTKAFERWAQPYVDSFEVNVARDPPRAVPWRDKIVDLDSLLASTATLGDHEAYAVAYATYPAWPGACLVAGVAVPAHDDVERAREVRDRFVEEVLPTLEVLTRDEPKEAY